MCKQCPCVSDPGPGPSLAPPLILLAVVLVLAGSSALVARVIHDLIITAAIVTGVLLAGGITGLVLLVRHRTRPADPLPARYAARQLTRSPAALERPAARPLPLPRPQRAALPGPRVIPGRVLPGRDQAAGRPERGTR